MFCTLVPFLIVTLEGFGRKLRRLLAVEARAAHDRFGLTHTWILHAMPGLGNLIPYFASQGLDEVHDSCGPNGVVVSDQKCDGSAECSCPGYTQDT
jgi:hypothetical protein